MLPTPPTPNYLRAGTSKKQIGSKPHLPSMASTLFSQKPTKKHSTASRLATCEPNVLSTNASRKYSLTKPHIRSMNPFCGTNPNRK